jgi:osmotically-inducible protein OsmY
MLTNTRAIAFSFASEALMPCARLVRPVVVMALVIAAGCTRKVADAGKIADATESTDGAKGNNSTKGIVSTQDTGAIAAEVRQRIASDPNIKSKQPRWREFTPTIQVRFHDGTIKLTGTVATDDESNAAGNDAIQVAGVQGVAGYASARFKFSIASSISAVFL